MSDILIKKDSLCLYFFTTDDDKDEVLCLVKTSTDVLEKDTSTIVRIIGCYRDTSFGAYKYLAKNKFDTGCSVEYLVNIDSLVRNKDTWGIYDTLCRLFGTDPMYFGLDGTFVAAHIIEHYGGV